jgi:hypothetical protein
MPTQIDPFFFDHERRLSPEDYAFASIAVDHTGVRIIGDVLQSLEQDRDLKNRRCVVQAEDDTWCEKS